MPSPTIIKTNSSTQHVTQDFFWPDVSGSQLTQSATVHFFFFCRLGNKDLSASSIVINICAKYRIQRSTVFPYMATVPYFDFFFSTTTQQQHTQKKIQNIHIKEYGAVLKFQWQLCYAAVYNSYDDSFNTLLKRL